MPEFLDPVLYHLLIYFRVYHYRFGVIGKGKFRFEINSQIQFTVIFNRQDLD